MELSELSRRIVRELCTDSRISVTDLTKKLGASRITIAQRIKSLETELGLLFTLEIDHEALGFTRLHILYLKFTKKPKPAELKRVFADDRIVQLVVTARGDFDLVVFAITKSSKEYFNWEIGLLISLARYGVSVHSSEATIKHLGFLRLDDALIASSDIDKLYKDILIRLNNNSRISIRKLAGQLNIHEDTLRYHLTKLEKTGMIKRFTAVITKSPLHVNIAYFANYSVKEGIEKRIVRERETMYFKRLDITPVVSEFQLMFSMVGGDISFTWACYDNEKEGFERSVATHARMYRVDLPVIKSAVVQDLIKGTPPIRSLDIRENYDTSGPGLG